MEQCPRLYNAAVYHRLGRRRGKQCSLAARVPNERGEGARISGLAAQSPPGRGSPHSQPGQRRRSGHQIQHEAQHRQAEEGRPYRRAPAPALALAFPDTSCRAPPVPSASCRSRRRHRGSAPRRGVKYPRVHLAALASPCAGCVTVRATQTRVQLRSTLPEVNLWKNRGKNKTPESDYSHIALGQGIF